MTNELIEYIVKQLVQHPEEVKISCAATNEKNVIEIAVHEADRGRVIGRDGQIIKALRMLIHAVATDGKKITIDVVK